MEQNQTTCARTAQTSGSSRVGCKDKDKDCRGSLSSEREREHRTKSNIGPNLSGFRVKGISKLLTVSQTQTRHTHTPDQKLTKKAATHVPICVPMVVLQQLLFSSPKRTRWTRCHTHISAHNPVPGPAGSSLQQDVDVSKRSLFQLLCTAKKRHTTPYYSATGATQKVTTDCSAPKPTEAPHAGQSRTG